MENLTVSQKKIIADLKEEFVKANTSASNINKSVIGELREQAIQYNVRKDNFYKSIGDNNSLILKKKEELLLAFYNKLVALFNPYGVLVHRSQNIILVGHNISNSEEPNFKKGYFYISGNVTIEGYPKFDENCREVNRYKEAVILLEGEPLNLDNFETNTIFKSKVFEMFK